MVEIQRKYTDPVDVEKEDRILKKYMGRQFDALEALEAIAIAKTEKPTSDSNSEALKAVQASVEKMEKSVELIDKSLLNVIDARIQTELNKRQKKGKE